MMDRHAQLPELLAPAGDWECVRAAVENGADAVYFGLDRFNARMRAKNFTLDDVPEVVAYLHGRGVRGYVTFNTLVFEDELPHAADYLRAIIESGIDAAIVQDLGVCRLIRSISPDFPIHASTQMTVSDAAGVRLARDLGCHLVVLARECSVREIERIRGELAAAAIEIPLEIFVHGALCVAYSGQCLTSEALGGRSANRGECAQACRLPYELISDGRKVDLGGRQYLLSPQDLAGIDMLQEIARAGVSSLKIEGRLKSPEYVAAVTRAYRAALDRIADGGSPTASPRERYELEMSFSRGLSTGWLRGVDNQYLVHARFSSKLGPRVGTVARVVNGEVEVRLTDEVAPGDGVCFASENGAGGRVGGRIYSVETSSSATRLAFGRDAFDFEDVEAGMAVFKTSDPKLERELRRAVESEAPNYTRPLVAEVSGRVGVPLAVSFRTRSGFSTSTESAMPLVRAERRPLDEALARDQLGRLGGTEYHLESLVWSVEGETMLPLKELNRIRRELVERLRAEAVKPSVWVVREEGEEIASRRASTDCAAAPPLLAVLARSTEQLEAACEVGADVLYCDLEEVKRSKEALAALRRAPAPNRPRLFVAPPRIFKPGEEWILKKVLAAEPDGVLARNARHLETFAHLPLVADFSFNVANHLAAGALFERHPFLRVTASHDLNALQLEALIGALPAGRSEVVLHHHMPMFHMEHCVFCAFLSTGTDYTNCGRPCDEHDVKIRDREGREHPLKADTGCRNTVYREEAQSAAGFARALHARGVGAFRIELLKEGKREALATLAAYREFFELRIDTSALFSRITAINQVGVTSGQLGYAATARVRRPSRFEILSASSS